MRSRCVWMAALLLLPLTADAQTTYHLHAESSPLTMGLLSLKTAGPDAPASARSIGIPNCAAYPCANSMNVWETPAGVPGQTGLILQGSTFTFTLWARKTTKWASVYPRAAISLASETIPGASYGSTPSIPICTATGATAVTTTWAAYNFSCSSVLSIAVSPDSRFVVTLYQWITVGPANHNVAFETGVEGTLNGTRDSRVSVPSFLSGMSLAPNCPAAIPDDNQPDDQALQDCLDAGGVVALAPGSYVIEQGLVLSQNNTTLIGRPWENTVSLIAHADLDAPMLRVADTATNYTISFLGFVGNRTQRNYVFQCGLGDEFRTHGYNLLLRGANFLVERSSSSSAMCGSAMDVAGNGFWLRHNDVSGNGFQEGESAVGESWSDGITVSQCRNGEVYRNTLADNTDVDLLVGPSGLPAGQYAYCIVHHNTIEHVTRYGFAGLMSGFGGNHLGMSLRANTVTSGPDKLAFGVMVGHHPWNSTTDQTMGEVRSNASTGSVTPLAIDGILNGTVNNNTPSGAQGTNGFRDCSLSAVYTAEHFGAASIQPGWYWRSYHNGSCTP